MFHNSSSKVVGANTRLAVSMCTTNFVGQLLHQTQGATIASVVIQCSKKECRVWVKVRGC
jgi:hypothetical protein